MVGFARPPGNERTGAELAAFDRATAKSKGDNRRGSLAARDDETDVDAEIARNLWKHHRMLPPGSEFKHYWDMWILVLTVYNLILTPMQFAYDSGPIFVGPAIPLVVIDVVIWFCLVADVIVNFRTSFFDEEHQIVLDSSLVHRRYLRGWFPMDLFSTLPYYPLAILIIGDAQAGLYALLKVPICFRIVRLVSKLNELTTGAISRVCLQMTAFIMVAHWVACCWWLIGEYEYNSSLNAVQPISTGIAWIRRVPSGSTQLSTNTTTTPFSQQYMSALYWSLTTLMKTPWVGPDTVAEKIFACAMVVLGATLFAMLLGNVTAMINTHGKRHAELRNRLTTLHNFAAFRRVPKSLQAKMFAYVDAYWNMTAGLDHSAILQSLPSRLRGSVLLAMHGSLLQDCAMLRSASEECAKTLLLKVKPQVCLQKEDLIIPGQLCTDLYVLITGSLQVTLPDAASGATDDKPAEASTLTEPSTSEKVKPAGGALRAEPSRSFTNARSSCLTAPRSLGLKAERLRFRVVEKPGQIIGLSEPFQQPAAFPFRVTALKTSQMVYITRQDLADVLSVFSGTDADAVCSVLRSEFSMTWETLKPRDGSTLPDGTFARRTAGGSPRRQARELSELRTQLGAFEKRLDGAMSSLASVQEQTTVLPQMHAVLMSLVQAHAGIKGS